MAKRKITKAELEAKIGAHAGNVLAIARSLNVTPQTIYNALDAYDMRSALDAARSSALESAAVVIAKAPQKLRVAIMMLAESTGGITKAELVNLLSEPISNVRPFANLHKPSKRDVIEK